MTDRKLLEQALDALIENARLLGITQAKQGYGFYSLQDAIVERALHECIAKHSAALLERLAQPDPEPLINLPACTWTYSADEDSWDAECGHKFSLNDGTPSENGMRYCHYCGQTIRQVESPGDSQS